MIEFLNKIELILATYCQARQAIRRQFNSDEIRRTQNDKLRRLISYCCENVKYYKETFQQAGVDPNQINTVANLGRIPILTKEELRDRLWDFLPHKLPPCRVTRSSGSTGVPVCFFSDQNSRKSNSAAVIRSRKAAGIPLVGMPILALLKTENDPTKKPHWTFLQGIHKTYYFNPYLNSAKNRNYALQLQKKLSKPALMGITPAMRVFAYKVHDEVFPYFKPSAILTGGESLSPDVRELIESAFRTNVTDIYGSSEVGEIAWQCHLGLGYHINADSCIVEVVNNDEPVAYGETGEVVVTNLNRYAMPIIRYKNGDLAKLSSETCPCGCKLPMIAEIVGRTGEDMILPTGKIVPWNQLKSLMTHQKIRQFQLVQNEDASLTIRYVPENGADTEKLDSLFLRRYHDFLGNSMKIKIEKSTTIYPAVSGKSKLVISRYKPD